MTLGLAISAGVALASLAGQVWAEPEVLVKCDSARPVGQRFTSAGGWQAFDPPDRAVTIVRDKGKYAIEVAGDAPFTSHLVFPLPQIHTERFRVMGHDGVENFYLVTGANSGKTELKHSIFGGKDGSHLFNIRVTTLDNCTVVSPDVAVMPETPGAAPKR